MNEVQTLTEKMDEELNILKSRYRNAIERGYKSFDLEVNFFPETFDRAILGLSRYATYDETRDAMFKANHETVKRIHDEAEVAVLSKFQDWLNAEKIPYYKDFSNENKKKFCIRFDGIDKEKYLKEIVDWRNK